MEKKRGYEKFFASKITLSIILLVVGMVGAGFVNKDIKLYFTNIIISLSILAIIIGIINLIPFGYIFRNYIVDPEDYLPNKSKADLTYKLRIRALLFNNLSVLILFCIVVVIVVGFYFLVNTPERSMTDAIDKVVSSASITGLIIFLVHVLFRVFKYLLRVAAFYNAKGDIIEYRVFDPSIDLTVLSEIFTPNSYDISDLPNTQDFGISTSTNASSTITRALPVKQNQASTSGTLNLTPGKEA